MLMYIKENICPLISPCPSDLAFSLSKLVGHVTMAHHKIIKYNSTIKNQAILSGLLNYK